MDRRETLRRIAREARPYAPQIVAALILGTVAGLLAIVPTWAFRVIVNGVLTPHKGVAPNQGVLYMGLGAIVASLVLANLATYYETYITAWSGQRLIANLRLRLFQHILRLPLERFDRWRPGELITRFSNDLQLMTDAVSISFPQMVVAVVTFVSSFALMLYLDWLLTLILVVVAPVISVAVSRFQKLISNGTKRTQARIADLSSNLTEILQGQRVVKAFGREKREVDRFHNRNEDMFGAYLKLTQFINTQPLVVSTMMIVAVVVIVWLSIREVLVGRLNTGSVFQYWLLLVNLANPLNRLAAFFGDIAKAIVGAGRVFEILDLPTEEHDRPDAQPLRDVKGRIDFENVSFTYGSEETRALHDINAHVQAGEIVALVGPSGAGKTTFANLVPRFYVPQHGRITIDGHDIADVRLGDLRDAIGIVPQDPQLFRDSVMENVRYGRLDATDDEVRAAAREANADQFIVQLPEGYNTEVGERGARLSGGERQRIAIARAIVRDPRILILDEATSALDSESEGLIEEALDRLLPGRTTLIIAHRLSTIRRAHRIFYLEDGRIVETGSHDELLAKGGSYARMYARQFGTAQLEESARPIRLVMADISALSFGTTVDMLSNAMRGAGANQDQLANNIANVNTPGFKRSTVSFKDALAQAAGGTPADSDMLPMATDDDRQFALGDAQAAVPFDPQAQTDNNTQMRSDGNNVDIDQEMAQLSQNSAYSQTMAQLLSTQFGMYHTAITDEPR